MRDEPGQPRNAAPTMLRDQWVAAAKGPAGHSWRKKAVTANSEWRSEYGTDLDLLIVSIGGIATTSLIQRFGNSGLTVNPANDAARLKHISKPTHPLLEGISVRVCLYLVGPVIPCLMSLDRRGFLADQSRKLTDYGENLPVNVTLSDLANEGRDMLGLTEHIRKWTDPHTESFYPRIISTIENVDKALHQIEQTLDRELDIELPNDGYQRASSEAQYEPTTILRLDSIYAATEEMVEKFHSNSVLIPPTVSEVFD